MDKVTELRYALDTFYFLISGALVMWMAAGFAMLEVPLTNPNVTFTAQLIGVATIFSWVFMSSLAIWSVIKLLMGIRVSANEEIEGLDIVECGQQAYPEFTGSADVLVTPPGGGGTPESAGSSSVGVAPTPA